MVWPGEARRVSGCVLRNGAARLSPGPLSLSFGGLGFMPFLLLVLLLLFIIIFRPLKATTQTHW
jgi:hypothetical protein